MNQRAGGNRTFGKQLWRRSQPEESTARTDLYTRRTVYILVTFGLLAALALLLTSPSRQPRTHVFIFEDRIPDLSRIEHIVALPPSPYPKALGENFPELRAIETGSDPAEQDQPPTGVIPHAYVHDVERIENVGNVIDQQIRSSAIRDRDVVIVYLRADGIVEGNELQLLTHSGQPKQPIKPVRVEALLDRLEFESSVTLLLIDYGQIEQDENDGIVINRFADSLRTAVKSRNRTNLWVAVSHNLLETSLVSDRDQRTVFESAVSNGIAGHADKNLDGWVDLQELFSYLAHHVTDRVDRESAGNLTQTPLFIWSGNSSPTDKLNRRLIPSRVQSPASNAPMQQAGLFPQIPWSLLAQSSATPNNDTPSTGIENPDVKSATESGKEQEKAQEPKPVTATELAATLEECWQIYHRLLAPNSAGEMPVSFYAPFAWKELESLLIHASFLARRPGSTDLTPLNDLLIREVLPLGQFDPLRPIPEAVGLARRIDAAFPRDYIIWPNPDSIELLQWVARQNRQPLEPKLLAAITAFNTALETTSVDAMQDWLKTNELLTSQYEEPKLCRQLLDDGVAWPMFQLIVETTRLSLRSRLYQQSASNDLRSMLSQADELLLYGRLYPGHRDGEVAVMASHALHKASALYESAIFFSHNLDEIYQRAWREIIATSQPRRGAVSTDDRLHGLLTEHAETDSLDDLVTFLQHEQDIDRLNSNHDVWPLLKQSDAGDLSNADGYSERLTNRARSLLNQIGANPSNTADDTPPGGMHQTFALQSLPVLVDHPPIPIQQWMFVKTRINRQFSKAKLAQRLWGNPLPEFQKLKAQFAAASQRFSTLENGSESESDSLPAVRDLYKSCETFGTAFESFTRELYDPATAPNEVKKQPRPTAFLGLRFPCCPNFETVDSGRTPSPLNSHFLVTRIANSAQALRDRLTQPVEVSPQALARLQRQAAEIKPRAWNRAIPPQRRSESLPLKLSRIDPINLRTTNAATFSLSIQSAADKEMPVWFALSNNSSGFGLKHIDREKQTERSVSRVSQFATTLTADESSEYRPLGKLIAAVKATPSALTLNSGEEQAVELTITRRGGRSVSSRIMLKVFCNDRIIDYPIWVDSGEQDPIRYQVASSDSIVSEHAAGWSVQMAPNSQTRLKLLATNTENAPHPIDIEVVALDTRPESLPSFGVSLREASRIQREWRDTQPLISRQKIVIPAEAEQAPVLDMMQAAKPETEVDPPEKPAEKPMASGESRQPIGPYLVAVIKNRSLDHVTFVPLSVEVMHPREYIQPRISWNSSTQTLDIEVERTRMVGETQRAIDIRANLSSTTDTTATYQFPITLAAGQMVTTLKTRLTDPTTPDLDLKLSIDGYPRAFRYEIDLRRSARNISISSASQFRILSPLPNFVVGSQLKQLDVAVQADLGFSSADENQSYLEFGIDIDRDRDLFEEPTVRLRKDRLALLSRDPASDTLDFANTVKDLTIAVPIDNLANQRVNLIGKVRVGDDEIWSQPIEIILDSNSPRITDMSLVDGGVIGKPVRFSVAVTDDQLSGVAKVAALLDIEGKGKITPESELVEAKRNQNGEWIVEIPTDTAKSGGYQLLGVATDRAGNVSDVSRTLVKLITEAELEELANAPTRVIRGRVTYGKSPVPEAEIDLTDAEDKSVGMAVTDDKGEFVIRELKPAKYTLNVRGVSRGKIRRLAEPIEIKSTETEISLELKLP